MSKTKRLVVVERGLLTSIPIVLITFDEPIRMILWLETLWFIYVEDIPLEYSSSKNGDPYSSILQSRVLWHLFEGLAYSKVA